ncbi:hypothetical protein [Halomonas sp.]|uniref:hypothetical protein n=1 Tax=Halomonas sp. TaxID=1486246 RepID=UPI003970B7A4
MRTLERIPSALAATDSQWLRRAKGRVWKSGRGAYALEESGLKEWLNNLPQGNVTR